VFPILTLPASQRTNFACQIQGGPINSRDFTGFLFYFTVVTVAVSAVEGVAFTVLSTLTTEVESVLEVEFSVDEPVPHDVKDKANVKAKTVKVFICY
jgi:hypothetical protein